MAKGYAVITVNRERMRMLLDPIIEAEQEAKKIHHQPHLREGKGNSWFI